MIDKDLVLDHLEGEEYEAYKLSCDPNIYIDGQVVFRLRDIEKNEFLCVDYGTFMLTKQDYILTVIVAVKIVEVKLLEKITNF